MDTEKSCIFEYELTKSAPANTHLYKVFTLKMFEFSLS